MAAKSKTRFQKVEKPVRTRVTGSSFEPDQDILDLLTQSEDERLQGLDNAYTVAIADTPVGKRRADEKGSPMVPAQDDITAASWVRKHAYHLGYGFGSHYDEGNDHIVVWTTKKRERKTSDQ